MYKPKVSIVIPVYNAEGSLCTCLNSVLGQTFSDFEVLLINDGSIDRSGDICDEYAQKDNRVQVFHKRNGGVSSARNVGLDNANGEWCTFVDADDWVYPIWLENFISFMSPECEMVIQGFSTNLPIHKNQAKDILTHGVDYKGDIEGMKNKLWQLGILGFVWVKIFRCDIIKQYGIKFHEEINFSEDTYFIMEYLSVIKEVTSTNRIGYNYNVPEWNTKYYNATFADMSLLLELCKKSLASKSKMLFVFYLDFMLHGLFDSYIKRMPSTRKYLLGIYDIIQDYQAQSFIVYNEKKFKILRNIMCIDNKHLSMTHFLLKSYFRLKKMNKQ